LVLITFQLATDFMLYTSILSLRDFVLERRHAAAELVRCTGPLFSSLLGQRRPAQALATSTSTLNPGATSRKRAVVEPEIGITDEEVEGFDPPEGTFETEEDRPKVNRSRRDKHEDDLAEIAADDSEEEDFGIGADLGSDSEDQEEMEGPLTREPAILEHDPESEVIPDPELIGTRSGKGRVQATIRFEPPATRPQRDASFDDGHTEIEAPEQPEHAEYVFPSLDLLEHPVPVSATEFQKMVEGNIEVLESSLASYKVEAEVEEIQKGPVITMFEMNVAPGTRVDRIRALEDDLAIRMKAPSVRIVAPIPGKSTIGIEVPNRIRETVRMRELLTSPDYESQNFAVPVFIGKDAAGRVLIEDLAKMPHLLVAGATGAGKSVCLNTIIMSILFTRTPDQVKMILIDPMMVELSSFESIPHLMCPVVRDMNRAAQILEWATVKMDERYNLLAEAGARNIFSYNKMPEEEKRRKLNVDADDDKFEPRMPFIMIIVDELADLMMVSAKDVENYITRLAQKSRAVGIHIVLATQRPSTNVITGLIKANLPTRISFQVASKIDSRVVLDQNGAEKLLGFGDMLYMPPRTSTVIRAQGAYVSDEEIKSVVESVRTIQPKYARELTQRNVKLEVNPQEVDSLYYEATRFICETRRGSASLLQRKFAIGYTRASRLIDLMAADGILGEYRNAQAREVLVTPEEFDARQEAD
ncbi:MAG: DNA translocase FtsK, partial [Planctomycetota bacterium]